MNQRQIDYRAYRIHDVAAGTCVEVSHADFVRDNSGDPDLCVDVDCLAKGWGFTVGGGAAPAFEIYRIA